MRQEQDFAAADFLGEERKDENAAKDRGVFYEEDGGRRGEDYDKTENIAKSGNRV